MAKITIKGISEPLYTYEERFPQYNGRIYIETRHQAYSDLTKWWQDALDNPTDVNKYKKSGIINNKKLHGCFLESIQLPDMDRLSEFDAQKIKAVLHYDYLELKN